MGTATHTKVDEASVLQCNDLVGGLGVVQFFHSPTEFNTAIFLSRTVMSAGLSPLSMHYSCMAQGCSHHDETHNTLSHLLIRSLTHTPKFGP